MKIWLSFTIPALFGTFIVFGNDPKPCAYWVCPLYLSILGGFLGLIIYRYFKSGEAAK